MTGYATHLPFSKSSSQWHPKSLKLLIPLVTSSQSMKPITSATFYDAFRSPAMKTYLKKKKRKYVHLSAQQFSVLMHCFQQQQTDISRLLSSSTLTATTDTSSITDSLSPTSNNIKMKTSDHYNNAKYENIVCHPPSS